MSSGKKQRYDLPEKETVKAIRMFEYYYSLGDKRTLKDVAKKFKVSKSTVLRYSSAFDWVQRVTDIESKAIDKLKDELVEDSTKIKRRYRLMIQKTIDTFVDRLNRGLVVVSDIVDLEKLVKLDMLLLGEATEKIDNKYEFLITEVKGRVGKVGDGGEVIEVEEVEIPKELKESGEEKIKEDENNTVVIDGEEIDIDLSSISPDEETEQVIPSYRTGKVTM